MDPTIYYRQLTSPLGKLLLTSDGAALTGLFMTRLAEESAPEPGARWVQDDGPFRAACEQLTSYFEGGLVTFDLTLALAGTPFQRRVWQELLQHPLRLCHLLRRAGPADRQAGRKPGGGQRQRPEPGLDHRPVPPRHRRRRRPGGLWRRPRPQALAPRARGRGPGAASRVAERSGSPGPSRPGWPLCDLGVSSGRSDHPWDKIPILSFYLGAL